MTDSEELVTKSSRKSRSSSSRKSRRSSKQAHKSSSPNINEPRRSRNSKEELEAKARALPTRDSGAAGTRSKDNVIGVAESTEGRRKKRASKKRRSQQQDRLSKDVATKVDNVFNRPTEATVGPMPGAHADSRGNQVDKKKDSGKGRFRRRLGTQSVLSEEGREDSEEKEEEHGGEGDTDGLVTASAVEGTDAEYAISLLNSMLDQEEDASRADGKQLKRLDNTMNGATPSDSNEDTPNSQNDESKGREWERLKQKKSVQICRYLLCFVVVVGVSLGAWLGLRDNKASVSNDEDAFLPIAESNITDAPVSAALPTQDPTTMSNSSTTNAPSGSPSIDLDVEFDPPSKEDCEAIRQGEVIEGQDKLPVQRYRLDLDATPFVSMVLDLSTNIIEDKLKEVLAPTLT